MNLKKSVSKVVALLLLSTSLYSCQKEQKSFSCDPAIDNYVKNNQDYINTLSRESIGLMRGDSSVAILHSLSAEKKYKLWQEKISLEMNDLSGKEKVYFQQLVSKYSPNIYINESDRIQFENYTKQWVQDVKSKLGWSDERIFLLTNILVTKREIQLSSAGYEEEIGLDGQTCYCRYSLSCEGTRHCIDKECGTNYKTDCGVFGTSACTGRCE